MNYLTVFIFIGAACYVYGETCNTVSECKHTACATTGSVSHQHLVCKDNQCTCSVDKKLCLLVDDCNHGRCIGNLGSLTQWHCVDGYCLCVNI